MNSTLNNGIPEEVTILDLLNVFSLWAQVDNMKMDIDQSKYIEKVIKAIANEIEKLHKENDIIMKQNDSIARMLQYIGLGEPELAFIYEDYKKISRERYKN